MMKLSAAQNELLEDIRAGVVVHYMSGINARYFRTDTMRTCTKTAQILEDKGLVERFEESFRGYTLRVPNTK